MDTAGFIHHLSSQKGYSDQISHSEHIPPRDPIFGTLENPLNPFLEKVLDDNALWPLYSHQAEAVNQARKLRNVMVATSSASGKTLCYNIPVLEAISSIESALNRLSAPPFRTAWKSASKLGM